MSKLISIGIIGPGKHFEKNIYPVLKKNNSINIEGILAKKKTYFKNIKTINEKVFFKKKFDFIYIAAPNKLHEHYIIKGLKNNSNIICEKPFLIRKKNIKKIINLAKKKKKLIFECFMYLYHELFQKLKSILKKKKFGKLKYVISNFRFPSLNKTDNRYDKKLGNGFFYDSAIYLISLENYLFNQLNFKKNRIFKNKITNVVDLRGYHFINNNNFQRFYFWGEGQNYNNNIELFFEKATVFINYFFSKKNSKNPNIIIHKNKKIFEIKIKKNNHFKKMFYEILKKYKNKNFINFHIKKINNQINLINQLK